LPKNDLFHGIKTALGIREKPEPPAALINFRDPLGNFTIAYPSGWKYDGDVAVLEGAYMISFSSPDGRCTFNIGVDAGLKRGFDFAKYAKAELESPTSGIYTPVKKGKFREMPSFTREYAYTSSGRPYFAGGVMFFTGRSVFSISWNAPEAEKKRFDALFNRMMESLIVLPGMTFRSGKF
jgi:hypothetical protein